MASLTFSASSRETTPETSSIESGPSPVEPNHLTAYFPSPSHSPTTETSFLQFHDLSDGGSPTFSERVAMQLDKGHDASVVSPAKSATIPPPNAVPNAVDVRNSLDIFSSKPAANHPFGAELEKVNELAEEIGARDVMILDDDEAFLMSRGLLKFDVENYMDEIQGLFGGSLGNPYGAYGIGWL